MARFWLVTLPSWILGTLMLAGVVISFANVIGRYVFGRPIFWTEEVLVFLTVWGVFAGMAAIAYNGDHLNMDLFSSRIRGPWKVALNVVTTIVLLACCGFVILQSFTVVSLFIQTGQVSVAASIPKAIPHSAILVGFVLMALGVVIRIRSYFTGKF